MPPEISNKMWMNILMAGAAMAAVATAVVVWQKISSNQPTSQTRNQALGLLYEFQHAAATPLHVLRQIAEHMAMEMHAGLMTEGKSNLLMLPTYVENLPDGTEEGLFYALDLGGTNFRVLRCLLGGKEGRVLKQEYEEVPIPKSLMLGTSNELFDFIAKRLVDFVTREGDEYRTKNRRQQDVREIGLTFSFPVKQKSVKSGILIQWSKGFKIADGVGADVVSLLQNAINRQHGPKIEVAVLVNDTVGTLAGGRYWNDDVMVGMILGTGTNACYVERDLPGHAHSSTGEMVINMEWGGFWSSHLPRTYADEQLDNESVNPGQAGYEKMIGGMYLGEIVRRVLLRMAREASLFGDPVPPKLREPFILITPEMSKMHGDESGDLRVVAKILRDVFGVQKTELPARRIVHDVCDIVTMRSARLAAAGIVGILKRIGGDSFDTAGASGTLKTLHRNSRVAQKMETGRIVVAMDGGLYEHYTQYRIYMQAAVNELLSEAAAKRLVIQLSKDGSGIGASILAACHSQYRGGSSTKSSYERTERDHASPEKPGRSPRGVHFGDSAGPKSSNTCQFTELDPKPTSSQYTQYDRPNLSSSPSLHDRPNLCNSQPLPNCQPASQHSISYIYGLNIF